MNIIMEELVFWCSGCGMTIAIEKDSCPNCGTSFKNEQDKRRFNQSLNILDHETASAVTNHIEALWPPKVLLFMDRLQRSSSDSDEDMQKISNELDKSFPDVANRVRTLANSASQGSVTRCETTLQSAIRIGLKEIHRLFLMSGLTRGAYNAPGEDFAVRFRKSCLVASAVSDMLADEVASKMRMPNEARSSFRREAGITALFANIGILAGFLHWGRDYVELFRGYRTDSLWGHDIDAERMFTSSLFLQLAARKEIQNDNENNIPLLPSNLIEGIRGAKFLDHPALSSLILQQMRLGGDVSGRVVARHHYTIGNSDPLTPVELSLTHLIRVADFIGSLPVKAMNDTTTAMSLLLREEQFVLSTEALGFRPPEKILTPSQLGLYINRSFEIAKQYGW